MSTKNPDLLGRDGEGSTPYLPKEETGISFPPDRTALLVIDPVNDFLSDGGAVWELTKTTVKMNDVVGHLKRARGCATARHPCRVRPDGVYGGGLCKRAVTTEKRD